MNLKYHQGWRQLQNQKKQEVLEHIIEKTIENTVLVVLCLVYFGLAFYLLNANW